MMKIIIANLADGEHKYEFKEPISFFEVNDIKAKEDISVEATLFKSNLQIHAKVNIKGELVFPCDRCTDDFIFLLNTDFEMVYKYTKDSTELESNDDENIFFVSPVTNNIDLKDIVREYILLALPMRKVPEETDGICTYCKKDIKEILRIENKQEINPVWEKLLNKN